MARAPEGLGVHTIVARAHIAAWAEAQDDAYWSPPVRREILAAAARYLESPRFVPSPCEVWNRNTFAFCSARFEEDELLCRQAERAEETLTPPWTYLKEGRVAYAAARARAEQVTGRPTTGGRRKAEQRQGHR